MTLKKTTSQTMKNFALIGAAGFIAPRHMRAIYDTGNRIVAALDKSDSVGILDSFSHDIAFFTEFERFDRHAEKLRRQGNKNKIHYVSICSPNYLHDAHIRFALRIGAVAICEKPLVLNPWNLDALAELERETGGKIYNVLQLRLHPSIVELKKNVDQATTKEKYQIDLTYVTSRGRWYSTSWKGDMAKSGGIATNIGIHFFDMLMWIYGDLKQFEVHLANDRRMAGYLLLEKAEVLWFLSIDQEDLPPATQASGLPTYRSILVDGEEFEFSAGFTDLHTLMYEKILANQGFGLDEARASIRLVHELRKAQPVSLRGDRFHPMLEKLSLTL